MSVDLHALDRELGDDWRAPLPARPTPAQEVEAFVADADAIHQAAQRIKVRRRAELIRWHREQLAELEEAA